MTKCFWVTLGTMLAAQALANVDGRIAQAQERPATASTRAMAADAESWANRLGTAHLRAADPFETQVGSNASNSRLLPPQMIVRGQGSCPSCGGQGCEACSEGCPSCGGAGCAACGGGRMRMPHGPGVVRAATMGWMSPNGCAGCQPNGFPPEASYYPYPYNSNHGCGMGGGMGCESASGSDQGYMNLGDTCCGPDWFDFMIEGVVLTRVSGTSVPLSSDGIRGFGPPNTVLSTDSPGFDYALGYRATGRFQISAVNSLEASYLGGLNWNRGASYTSNNNGIFSTFSDFGNNPFGGYLETDQATIHSIEVDSELDGVDVAYRRGWVSPSHRVGGAWSLGARWIRFKDSLAFASIVNRHLDPTANPIATRPDATFDYSIATRNDLVGPQLGTDLNICLIPGLMLGGDAKVAVYGNGLQQSSNIRGTRSPLNLPTTTNTLTEFASDTSFAYGSEGRAYAIWQFHPLCKLRGGYEVLFVDRVATAAGNFNTAAPFDPMVTRTVDANDNDQLLVHGFDIGLEFGW